jgi:hypothetical protein
VTRCELGWLVGSGLPVLVAAGVALAMGRPDHAVSGGLAFGLCVPTAVGTFAAAKWFAARSPFGGLLGMAVGVPVRVLAALGGGMAIFYGVRWTDESPVGFLFWLLAAYLLTLVAETVLLAVPLPAPDARARLEGE